MSSSNDSLAMQRITKLVDENSFMEIGSLVTARNTDFNLADTDTPSDGVITGYGLIDGNLVYVYSQDASVLNGTIGEMHAKKIASVYDMAMKMSSLRTSRRKGRRPKRFWRAGVSPRSESSEAKTIRMFSRISAGI